MGSPKLILLNGPCGIGKSTLAQRYIDDHPMVLNLDIDSIWEMMGQWRNTRPQSNVQKFKYADMLASTHLSDGYDVVVPNTLWQIETIERFENIAQNVGVRLVEIALMTDVDDAIERYIKRGQALGYPTGFTPGGIMERDGGAEKLRSMFEDLQSVIQQRPETIVIQSVEGREDDTYAFMVSKCK